ADAKRVFLMPRALFSEAESTLRSAGSTNNRNSSPALMSNALPPVRRSSPRAFADSSDVHVGACSTVRYATPAAARRARIDWRTEGMRERVCSVQFADRIREDRPGWPWHPHSKQRLQK